MGKNMEHQISDALQPPKPKKKFTAKALSGNTTVTSSPQMPSRNAANQCIPTAAAGSSTIVRAGQIPSISAQSPLNLVDIFNNLKRAGGCSIRINNENSISIDITK